MSDDPPTNENASSPVYEKADITYPLDEDERPSEAVVRAVASLTDTPILNLDPLYYVIDTDNLNGLSNSREDSIVTGVSSITFRFNGCTVTVTPDTIFASEGGDSCSETD